MRKIGLTGGIATGKSTVAEILAREDAKVIDSDRLAREVVEPGGDALTLLVDEFGERILTSEGRLDRKLLADIIFGDAVARKKVERIIHPFVIRRIEGILWNLERRHGQNHAGTTVVLEVPLLIETGYHRQVDEVWVVVADEEDQMERLRRRDGIDEEAARRRIDAQMPLEEKVKYADVVINNCGSLADTRRQVIAALRRTR